MNKFHCAIASLLAVSVAGCSNEQAPSTAQATPDAAYVTSSEPQGAVDVGSARKDVKDQDEVVLVTSRCAGGLESAATQSRISM